MNILESVVTRINESHAQRLPLIMCSPNPAEQLTSYDYFYSMIEITRGNFDHQLRRPKQYKKLSGVDNSIYEGLQVVKKQLYSTLSKKLAINKPSYLAKEFNKAIQTHQSFDNLSFLNATALQSTTLREIYEKKAAEEKERLERFNDLRKLLDPHHLTESQKAFLSNLEAFRKARNWETNKQKIFEEFLAIWEFQKGEIYQHIENNKQDYFAHTFQNYVRGMIYPNYIQNKGNEKVKLILSPEFGIILRLICVEIKKDVEQREDTSVFENFFENNQVLLNELIERQVEEDFKIIKEVMKEQKQHAFARFCRLVKNYENFARHAQLVAETAENLGSGLKEKAYQILRVIVENSPIEPPQPSDIEKLKGKSDSVSQLKLIRLLDDLSKLTVKDNHHAPHIMGHEKKDCYNAEIKVLALNTINRALQTQESSQSIKTFQRAHTFPFPAVFNWCDRAVQKIFTTNGLVISQQSVSVERFITAKFFKLVQDQKISENELDECFKQELDEIIKLTSTPTDFLYRALTFLQNYYLRVFSEAEYTPDFINQELDQLSEWATHDNNYKRSLADAILKLLDPSKSVTYQDATHALTDYFEGTHNKILKKIEEWKRDLTIFNIVRLVGLIQILQGHITASQMDSTAYTSGKVGQQLIKKIRKIESISQMNDCSTKV